jgi:hypothetical protein
LGWPARPQRQVPVPAALGSLVGVMGSLQGRHAVGAGAIDRLCSLSRRIRDEASAHVDRRHVIGIAREPHFVAAELQTDRIKTRSEGSASTSRPTAAGGTRQERTPVDQSRYRYRSLRLSNSRYSPTSSAQYFLPEGEVADARP